MRCQGDWLSAKFYFAVFGRRQGRGQTTRKKATQCPAILTEAFSLRDQSGKSRRVLTDPSCPLGLANPNTGFASPWPQAET